MTIEFSGSIWYWRGPAPHYFVSVPESESEELKEILKSVSYGWGMIPVRATIRGITFETSLFPKDGAYIVPIKMSVRKPLDLSEGDEVDLHLEVIFSQD